MSSRRKIPCSIIRGGTSKGLYFLERDIPGEGEERDRFLLKVMGSPDPKQIDGLGGGASVTSKAAIIRPSSREDADVDYTFAQVSVDKPLVSYKGNCGNISSGVGPFAIEKGLVKGVEPITRVRIYNTNTDKIIVAEVRVEQGRVQYEGDTSLGGVPGTAAPIKLKFMDPAGTISPYLLPTGHETDLLEVPGFGKVKVSIVDAANPLVFVMAGDLGLRGTELPEELDQDPEKLELLERVRGMAAVRLGLIQDYKSSPWSCPGIPKMTVVSPPVSYEASDGTWIEEGEIDLTGRMMSMQKTHPTYAMTGAMCTAAAAVAGKSVVAKAVRRGFDHEHLRIGHPGGIMEAGVDYGRQEEKLMINYASGIRTANLLMEGYFFY